MDEEDEEEGTPTSLRSLSQPLFADGSPREQYGATALEGEETNLFQNLETKPLLNDSNDSSSWRDGEKKKKTSYGATSTEEEELLWMRGVMEPLLGKQERVFDAMVKSKLFTNTMAFLPN